MVERKKAGRPKVTKPEMDVEWFRARQKELDLTQTDIAVALGRHLTQISSVYSGRRVWNLKDVAQIAALFKVSPGEIMKRMGLPVADVGVPLAGKVLSSGRVSFVIARKGEPAPVPPMPAGAQALTVEADGPFSGATLVYLPVEDGAPVPLENINRLCVVELEDQHAPIVGTLVHAANRKVMLDVFLSKETLPTNRMLRAAPIFAIFLA